MFKKIIDFFTGYEDLLKFCLIIFLFIIFMLLLAKYFDLELTKEKNIIESTKQYYNYNECKKIDNIWYCWN